MISPVNAQVHHDDQQAGYRISTIITAYNRPDYLYYALESALSQSYPSQQIVIVDDASPADLNKVISELDGVARSHKFAGEIIYHRQDSNQGANAARNKGIELATGDWLAFLDDDDVWLPEKNLEQISRLVLAENTIEELNSGRQDKPAGPIAALCSYRFLESGELRSGLPDGPVELELLKRGNPYCGASGLIVKRAVIDKLKFDEGLPCGQDWDMYVRLAQMGEMIYSSKELYLYRRGSHDSLTTKAKRLSLQEADSRLASCYKHQDWLGKKYFRRRAAGQILSYVYYKEKRIAWVMKAIKVAGLRATMNVLLRKLTKRVRG